MTRLLIRCYTVNALNQKWSNLFGVRRPGAALSQLPKDAASRCNKAALGAALQREIIPMSYPRLELNDKVAVVIGGTSGVGLAIAKGMADAGADVIPTSRRQDQVEAASREIENRGRRSIRVTSDVGDRASLQSVLDESIKAFGKVDVLVNSHRNTPCGPGIWAPHVGTRVRKHYQYRFPLNVCRLV